MGAGPNVGAGPNAQARPAPLLRPRADDGGAAGKDTGIIHPQGELLPGRNTLPAAGHDDPLKEPSRPARSRHVPDRFGFGVAALASHYVELSGKGFSANRATEPMFMVHGEHTLERLLDRVDNVPKAMLGTACVAVGPGWADGPNMYAQGMDDDVKVMQRVCDDKFEKVINATYHEEIIEAYGALGLEEQLALTMTLDHEEVAKEYGAKSPQAKLIREMYGMAMVDAARHGVMLPALSPLVMAMAGPDAGTLYSIDDEAVWKEELSGTPLWDESSYAVDQDLVMLAKSKANPDVVSERQMRGPEWNTPKQREVAKFEDLQAKTDVAADDPKIQGMPVCNTMWVGKIKRDDCNNVLKLNARCVLRGDQQKGLSPNTCFAPVVRNASLCCCEAVGRLRRQHYSSGDVPGAYLQGDQRACEQAVARPPPGFRKWDERGVEILWLMNNPMYGQGDAGHIWNRTANDYITDEKPRGCEFARGPQEPCVYSKRAEDKESEDVVTLAMYVDDWRIYWDPSPTATAEAKWARDRLTEKFKIQWKEPDPETDFFLGSNRLAYDLDSATLRATSYIELQVEHYLGGMDELDKYPKHWTYSPSDPSMQKDWERCVATRPKASADLVKRYGTLFGSLLHATKFRCDISTTLQKCGTCLTFPTEEMYGWLVRCLVYLGRTRKLGVTYSNKGKGAYTLRCYADSDWSETRSTTGFVMILAGGAITSSSKRQHCITMSSCEAELVALADAAIELLYVMELVRFIGLEIDGAVEVYTDNKGAYDLCHRYTSAQHSRHVDRKMFKMRELRGAGVVTVSHIPTADNPADMFTKILARHDFEKHRCFVMNKAAEVEEREVHTGNTELKKSAGAVTADVKEKVSGTAAVATPRRAKFKIVRADDDDGELPPRCLTLSKPASP